LVLMGIREIVHIDMGAFYTSLEQRDNPELRGKPVIVPWKRNRSVVRAKVELGKHVEEIILKPMRTRLHILLKANGIFSAKSRFQALQIECGVGMVPGGGIEPPRYQVPADFESAASASSAIPAQAGSLTISKTGLLTC
jgi:impB/mucB/samB family protein